MSMKTRASLSEDEIIRDWSLTTDDKRFVGKFKTQYRLWIYLQVCALRMFGQLLENLNALDSRIVGHACNTLNLPILDTVEIPSRNATRTEYKKQIFDHLSFTRFLMYIPTLPVNFQFTTQMLFPALHGNRFLLLMVFWIIIPFLSLKNIQQIQRDLLNTCLHFVIC